MTKWLWIAVLAGLIASLSQAQAQVTPAAAPTSTIETHSLAPIGMPAPFDPVKATNAYLAQVNGAARARSDAYFEGGYVLVLVDTIYAVAVAAFLLWFRVSAFIRDFAERQTRSRFWQVPLYVGPYILLTLALTFPLTLFEDFFRERAYGLMNQTFLSWFLDFLTSTGVNLITGMIVLTVGYAFVRRSPDWWWLRATGLFAVFAVIAAVIGPVLIAPLFNTYTPLPNSPLKHGILTLAQANGIPAKNVYLVDESRQSDRISANVSGFLGTTRISLNDNLLKKSTHDEVLSVMGHEMGHYVLDHTILELTILTWIMLVGFAFLHVGYQFTTSLFGGAWDVRRIDDPAGLPVLAALASIYLLFATPLTNSVARMAETQADMYGLNAVRKPDAFATSILKLSYYRKLDPSPLEEFIFYDHPSGRTRIWEAMRWKAGHIADPDIKDGTVSPQ